MTTRSLLNPSFTVEVDGVTMTLPRLRCRLPDGRLGWYQRGRDDCLKAAVATCLQHPYDDLASLDPPEQHDKVGELRLWFALFEWANSQGLGVPRSDFPGRVTSLTVTNKSGNDQLGLMWHARCKNYSSAETAKWAYDAQELTPLHGSSLWEVGGGGKAIGNVSLPLAWTPVASTNLKAGAFLTHVGVYDVWARVFTTSPEPQEKPWLRLLWDIGDSIAPQENQQVQVPRKTDYYLVNLGQVNLRRSPFGEHRWQGVIQARAANSGGQNNIYIERLWFQCADESSGSLSAPVTPKVGIGGFKAWDEFIEKGGEPLNGLLLPTGGNWVTKGSTKGDFTTTGTAVKRETKEDAEDRLAEAPIEALGAVAMRMSWAWSALPTSGMTEPHVRSSLQWGGSETGIGAYHTDFKGTPFSWLVFFNQSYPAPLNAENNNEWEPLAIYTFTVLVIGGRYALGWLTRNDEEPSGPPDYFTATTGLSTAKVRIGDRHTGTQSIERAYFNFAMWEPQSDAVVYANRIASLSEKGAFRQSADGGGYGSVARPLMDNPRLPVSGPEGRPVEIAIKMSRGDLAKMPDLGKDKFTAQLTYRPCWSEIPGS
jgi:hypothetical protein